MSASVVAYVWAIDGVSKLFVTDEGLDATWAAAQGFASTHPGLRPPDGLSCGIDLRSGMLRDDAGKLHVDDVDGSLAALFRGSLADADQLISTLEPGATAGASLHGKDVGIEAIGTAGERRRYSCVPGFAVGLKHYGALEAAQNQLGSTPVSDGPILWAGRRCAVYRVRKAAGGAWQTLASSKRVWWGTLRASGDYARQSWAFSCLGPQSWTGGNLGRGSFDDALPVTPITKIETGPGLGEHRLTASLDLPRLDDLAAISHTYVDERTDATYMVAATSYEDVRTAISSFLADVVSDVSLGTAFNVDGNTITFVTIVGADGITVRWSRGDTVAFGDPYTDAGDTTKRVARLRLTAHEKVWRVLGYDPRTQNSDRDPVENADQYGQFAGPVYGAPGYWEGTFYSANARAMLGFEKQEVDWIGSENDHENGGQPRRWPPIYPGGAVSFNAEPGQEFQIRTLDPLLLAGSRSWPIMADPDDSTSAITIGGGVGLANRQGLLVLEGPYRRRGDAEQVDPLEGYAFELERERREGRTIQVARVAWRSIGGAVVADAAGFPRLVVYEWRDPRALGFDFRPIDGSWGAFRLPPPDGESIVARPLTVWEYGGAGDRVSTIVQRLLLTTGTAGEWYSDAGLTTQLYGTGGAAFLDAGANDTGGQIPKDAEEASLGLGVPASMVASPASFAAADETVGDSLRRCKAVAYGVYSSADLLRTLLAPTGLALGLAGGRYGLFDTWTFPEPDAAALTITPEMYAGKPGDPASTRPTQRLRVAAPLDRLVVQARVEPTTREYHQRIEIASTDPGTSYRSQTITHTVNGDHLVHPSLPIPGANWRQDLGPRWARGFDWWHVDHSELQLKLHAEDALDVWPGDGVLVTDSQVLGSVGEYGVSLARGRVTDRQYDASKETISIRILLAGESSFRMYAPAAVVTRYDENDEALGYRLLCKDDHLGDRSGGFDVAGFVEPEWSSEGGDADVEVWQFDAGAWTGGRYGTVASVSASAGACSITLTGALTGATYLRDRHTVVELRRWSDQGAAWVRRWHAPITEEDGTHSAGTDGAKFRGI